MLEFEIVTHGKKRFSKTSAKDYERGTATIYNRKVDALSSSRLFKKEKLSLYLGSVINDARPPPSTFA